MKWLKPHPSNAERAEEANTAERPTIAKDYVLLAIADRLAGIEEALTSIAISPRRKP